MASAFFALHCPPPRTSEGCLRRAHSATATPNLRALAAVHLPVQAVTWLTRGRHCHSSRRQWRGCGRAGLAGAPHGVAVSADRRLLLLPPPPPPPPSPHISDSCRSQPSSPSLQCPPTSTVRVCPYTGGSQGHYHVHDWCRCCALTHPRAVHAVLRCAGGSQGHQHVPWRRLLRLLSGHGSLNPRRGSAAGGSSRQR